MARIRLKYIHSDTDRHGRVRYYFYKRGADRKLRMPGLPGSAEFMAAYGAALQGLPLPKPESKMPTLAHPSSGTLDWLCSAYYESAEFKALAISTQKMKRCLLRLICRQLVAPESKTCFGALPYADMTSRAVRLLRDRRADMPGAANNWLIALNTVYVWAINAELAAHNPVRDVPKIKHRSDGHHTWTVEEIRKFETTHPIGTQARLAFALLAFTGQRRSDIVELGPQHVRAGRLRFTQQKNKKRKPVTIEIPILPELAHIIQASQTGHLAFVVNAYDKPWSAGGFGAKFREWCDEAGLPHCSAHGMRKAAACAAAEGGASEMEMMSIFGWETAEMARVYTRKASRGEMAARSMHLLASRQNEVHTNVSHLDIGKPSGGKKSRKSP